jgi:hypothetical protein
MKPTIVIVAFAALAWKQSALAKVALSREDNLYWDRLVQDTLDSFIVPTVSPVAPVPLTAAPLAPVSPTVAPVVVPSVAPFPPTVAPVAFPSFTPVSPTVTPVAPTGPIAPPAGPPTMVPTLRPISNPTSSPTTDAMCSVEVSVAREGLKVWMMYLFLSIFVLILDSFYTGNNRMCHG